MIGIRLLGDNVVVAEGDAWKRHRRVTAPAFNHTTYKNVWETTVRVYGEMLSAEGWEDADAQETPITDFSVITHKVTPLFNYTSASTKVLAACTILGCNRRLQSSDVLGRAGTG